MDDREYLARQFETNRSHLRAVAYGARAVAERVASFTQLAPLARTVLVNGTPGFVVAPGGRAVAVSGFTVVGGRIAEIDLLADPAED